MEKFTVFKDINLFLRKVLFRFLHDQRNRGPGACKTLQEYDKKVFEDLLALLDEKPSDVNSQIDDDTVVPRHADLKIKSKKTLLLSKNKLIGQFFDLVSNELNKLNQEDSLNEVKNAKGITIKKSDKGSDVILMSEENYVKEVKRQLGNPDIYLKLSSSPFSSLVLELNYKLT